MAALHRLCLDCSITAPRSWEDGMNEPECARCQVAMNKGVIGNPSVTGAIYWHPAPDQQTATLRRRSRKEIKSMIEQGNLAELGLISYAVEAYRCDACGRLEFYAPER